MFTRAHGSLPLPEGSSPEEDSLPLRGALSASRAQPLILPLKFRSDAKLRGLIENYARFAQAGIDSLGGSNPVSRPGSFLPSAEVNNENS